LFEYDLYFSFDSQPDHLTDTILLYSVFVNISGSLDKSASLDIEVFSCQSIIICSYGFKPSLNTCLCCNLSLISLCMSVLLFLLGKKTKAILSRNVG